MSSHRVIRLTGIAGFSKGNTLDVYAGRSVTVGRSRDCDFHIQPHGEPPAQTDNPNHGTSGKEKHLKTVSRTHVTIEYRDAKHVFIEDSSTHGTFLNDVKLSGRDRVTGLKNGPIELRLGTNEAIRMEFVTVDADPPKITIKRRDD